MTDVTPAISAEGKTVTHVLQIDDLQVTVTATLVEHTDPPKINYTAKCGPGKAVHHSVTFHPHSQRTAAHVDDDDAKAIRAVAERAAHNEKSRLLLANKFAKGQQNGTP